MRFLTDYSETDEIKDTALRSMSSYGNIISAVALDKNKVFIAHSSSSVETMNYLYGVVCIINKNTVSVGNDVKISTFQNSGSVISAVALNDSKVFIAHLGGSSSVLTSMVCTINGTSISVGVQAQLSGTANSGKVISAVKLDEGRVLIVHSYGANYYLYGIVCTISGTTVIKGSATQLSTAVSTGNAISVVTLNENKVFIAHRYGNNRNLYGLVCTISGTTITKGTETQISSLVNAGISTSIVALSENKVFIAFNYENIYILGGKICTISETNILTGMNLLLNSNSYTGKVISAIALNENTVNILHSDSNNYLYSMLCGISGTNVTKKNDSLVSNATNVGTEISAVALSENNIFIGHSSGTNNYLYGMVLGYLENLVKTITSSTERIDGIAITDGQAGEMVQVKKPDETLEITLNATMTAGGNSISWNNVKLSHRKVLDNSNKIYTPEKLLIVEGVEYIFKYFIHYDKTYRAWLLGCEFNHVLYTENSVVNSNSLRWLTPLSDLGNATATKYTSANSTGEKITITANVTI